MGEATAVGSGRTEVAEAGSGEAWSAAVGSVGGGGRRRGWSHGGGQRMVSRGWSRRTVTGAASEVDGARIWTMEMQESARA